jgi:hypothetical protein
MCTLTAFPLSGGVIRLAFNRDESRLRPTGLPPALRVLGARRMLAPIDPQGGGTWIGVNDSGMAAALMNVHDPVGAASPRWSDQASRGEIVPALLEAAHVSEARERALRLDPRRYPPFRVFLCRGRESLEVVSLGASLRASAITPIDGPMMRTTSGLGDDRVDAPRRALFEILVRRGDPCGVQDSFHRHSWAAHPEISVCMRRPAAATVSHAMVEVDPVRGLATFLYHPAPPDEPASRDVALLELA